MGRQVTLCQTRLPHQKDKIRAFDNIQLGKDHQARRFMDQFIDICQRLIVMAVFIRHRMLLLRVPDTYEEIELDRHFQ